jgi:hypothetical protein
MTWSGAQFLFVLYAGKRLYNSTRSWEVFLETSVEIVHSLSTDSSRGTDSRPETFLSFTLHVSRKPFIKWSIVSCLAEENRKTDMQSVSAVNTKLTQATDMPGNLKCARVYAQQPILSLLQLLS